MRPIDFSKSSQHQRAVLALYKELHRHLAHLPTAQPPEQHTLKNHAAFKANLRTLFRSRKGLRSAHHTRESLTKGYELDRLLRQWFHYPISRPVLAYQIETILNPPKQETTNKNPTAPLRNRHGELIKRDLSNEQDLQTQQYHNYLSRHIRHLQSQNKLPQTPSMIPDTIKQGLLLPESLHQRAKMDIQRTQRLIQLGPYQPRLVKSASGVKFVRHPFVQNPAIGRLIGLKVRKEQNLINLQMAFHDSEKRLYEWEDLYESKINDVFSKGEDGESKDPLRGLVSLGFLKSQEEGIGGWVEGMDRIIAMKKDELFRERQRLKVHNKTKSQLILKYFEGKSAKWFKRRFERWESLQREITKNENDNGNAVIDSPFASELLGKTGNGGDLWSLVRKYHFCSARVKKPALNSISSHVIK